MLNKPAHIKHFNALQRFQSAVLYGDIFGNKYSSFDFQVSLMSGVPKTKSSGFTQLEKGKYTSIDVLARRF